MFLRNLSMCRTSNIINSLTYSKYTYMYTIMFEIYNSRVITRTYVVVNVDDVSAIFAATDGSSVEPHTKNGNFSFNAALYFG